MFVLGRGEDMRGEEMWVAVLDRGEEYVGMWVVSLTLRVRIFVWQFQPQGDDNGAGRVRFE